MRESYEAFDEAKRLLSEGCLGTTCCAEQVGDQWRRRSKGLGVEQGRSARGNDPAMNLCNLQIGVDGSLDYDEISISSQTVEVGPQIGKRGLRHAG